MSKSYDTTKIIKYSIIASLVLIITTIIGCNSITRIDVGHVGVKVKLSGSNRGVQDMQLKTGWAVFNPITETIIEFPTKVESVTLTKDPNEGLQKGEKPNHGIDESITFSSKEGVNVNADIGFSFHIQPDMAPQVYSRFRQNDMHEFSAGFLRNVVRDSLNEVASTMVIQDIYGAGKSSLISEALMKCRAVLSPDGIIVDQLTIQGSLRLPQNVAEAINNAIAQTQSAIQSENKVRQIQAEADQKITQSKGEAEAARQKAQGEADSLIINTKAQAETRITQAQSHAKANKILSESLTPQLIQLKAIDQWNGVLPQYTGGATPMINIK